MVCGRGARGRGRGGEAMQKSGRRGQQIVGGPRTRWPRGKSGRLGGGGGNFFWLLWPLWLLWLLLEWQLLLWLWLPWLPWLRLADVLSHVWRVHAGVQAGVHGRSLERGLGLDCCLPPGLVVFAAVVVFAVVVFFVVVNFSVVVVFSIVFSVVVVVALAALAALARGSEPHPCRPPPGPRARRNMGAWCASKARGAAMTRRRAAMTCSSSIETRRRLAQDAGPELRACWPVGPRAPIAGQTPAAKQPPCSASSKHSALPIAAVTLAGRQARVRVAHSAGGCKRCCRACVKPLVTRALPCTSERDSNTQDQDHQGQARQTPG